MPIDRAQKRASAFTFNSPWHLPTLTPDANWEQSDRQQSLWNYSGILVPTVHVPTAVPVLGDGIYRPAINIFFSRVEIKLSEWYLAIQVRAIPEHLQSVSLLLTLNAAIQARSIAVSRISGLWAQTEIDIRYRTFIRANAQIRFEPYTSKNRTILWIGMTHMRRLLDDELEIGLLIGKR